MWRKHCVFRNFDSKFLHKTCGIEKHPVSSHLLPNTVSFSYAKSYETIIDNVFILKYLYIVKIHFTILITDTILSNVRKNNEHTFEQRGGRYWLICRHPRNVRVWMSMAQHICFHRGGKQKGSQISEENIHKTNLIIFKELMWRMLDGFRSKALCPDTCDIRWILC